MAFTYTHKDGDDTMPRTYTPNYPATVAEVLRRPINFRRRTLRVVRDFARSRPWRGDFRDRCRKFEALHGQLCALYGKATELFIDTSAAWGRDSGDSHYRPGRDLIVLKGRLSVVTYLHEFAHALGRDERGAVRWSVALFRECFPRSYARARACGHVLRAGR
jgi:hypothetical protein